MKKNLFIIALLLLVAISIYFLVNDKKYDTVNSDEVEFAVDDIEKIDRIVLKTKAGDLVDLEKKDGQWMVNNTYPAFQPVINVFLKETISTIRVKGPVAKAARENVIRSMVGTAIKVTIESEGDIIKQYYVGGSTPNQLGTYVHMEGSSTPFEAYIPGFDGYITPRFSLVPKEWYDRTVFDYDAEELESIIVTNTELPNESFRLNRVADDSLFSMEPIGGTSINQKAAKSYFAMFSFKNFEGFADYLPDSSVTQVKNMGPFMTIAAIARSGDRSTLNLYHKGNKLGNNTIYDKNGDPIVYDQERYFATIDGLDKLVTVQEYNFGELMVTKSDFLR